MNRIIILVLAIIIASPSVVSDWIQVEEPPNEENNGFAATKTVEIDGTRSLFFGLALFVFGFLFWKVIKSYVYEKQREPDIVLVRKSTKDIGPIPGKTMIKVLKDGTKVRWRG